MAATAEPPAKHGLLAGWDFGDTLRLVMAAEMVWLTIVAPATTTLPSPYAELSLAAYYFSLALVLVPPHFLARFGKPRVIAPGDGSVFNLACDGRTNWGRSQVSMTATSEIQSERGLISGWDLRSPRPEISQAAVRP